jgi:8-oxo-dGTP diphosphatase
MEKVILTNMCMITNEYTNQIVVQELAECGKEISLPSGEIEAGTGIIRSTIREMKRKTGLNISNIVFCGIKDWYDQKKEERHIVFLLKTSIYTGELIGESSEGRVFWYDLNKVLKAKLAPDFKEIFNICMDNSPYHELFYDDTGDNDEEERWKKCFF